MPVPAHSPAGESAIVILARAALAAGCPADQIVNFVRGRYVPQPRQLQFHAAARACDDPAGPSAVGFGGARGPGKSHALLAQLALDDCQRQPGLKCLLLRKVGKAAREGFEDLRLRVLRRVENDYRRSDGILRFPNGSRIHLGHFQDESDIDAYLGLEYDAIGVEEATTLTWSKYKAIRTCCRTSKPGWRPRIYSTTNPGNVGHAWYKALFIKPYQAHAETDMGRADLHGARTCPAPRPPGVQANGQRPGGARFIPATIDDNAFINPEYLKTLDELTGWQKRAWRFGDWDIAAGQFFTTFRQEVHVCEPPATIPPNWRAWLAMDYGFTHYNVILLLAQDGDGQVYVLDELAERGWLVPRHAEALRAMMARWSLGPERIERFVAGRDVFAARPTVEGAIADQWAAAGWTLEPADDDRISGAAELLRRLGDTDMTGGNLPPGALPGGASAPTLHISRRCARLLECLPILEHDPRRPEDVLKVDTDDDGQGGDDAYDALRYGLMVAASYAGQAGGPRPGVDVAGVLDGWRG